MPPSHNSLRLRTLRQLISTWSPVQGESLFRSRCFSTATPTLTRPQCTPRNPLSRLSSIALSSRHFTTTSPLLKKKTKADREAESDAAPSAAIEDPSDFSTLESGIKSVLKKLEHDLSKLKTGGRFNPEILENVRVHLVKDSKKSERLGDLAQVLPKGGRSVAVLIGEKDHIKPIISSIQSSKDLNLQPILDAHNPAQLNIPIPPPTKESRDQALAAASRAGETANLGVKNARAAMQKKLRAMEVKKVVRPDDLKKAGKEMEKIVEKGHADVKKIVDTAKKGMEQS